MPTQIEFYIAWGGNEMKKITSERYQESYYEETLENGLRVILWEKKDYEKSLFMMATPFGAMHLKQRTKDGNMVTHPCGIAHFLEHKMFAFQGDDVMNLFSDMGANVNAFTSYQETVYYASTSGEVKDVLNLLLDFVQTLEIDEATVEKEKGIIVSELHMYKEMSDQRLLMETYSSLYQKHPMKYDIGGDDESVIQTTVEQLYACYDMNYHPSNMTLICVSGKDPQMLMDIIKQNQQLKQFANVHGVDNIKEEEPNEVARSSFSFTMDVTEPKICVGYKLSGIQDPYERLRKEWCIRFLLDANFTTLYPHYQKWIDDGIINDYCGCDVDFGEDYGMILFFAETKDVDAFISLCEACMDRIKATVIQETVLEQLKRRYYAQSIRSLNSFDDIAISFVRSLFHHMDYFTTLDLMIDITMDDLKQASTEILKEHRAIVTLLPKSEDM